MKRISLRFSATLEHRVMAIDVISALVGQIEGATRDFRNELVTAFGEAFNNIVIHGYRDRSDGMLDVEAEMNSKGMCVRLIDTGNQVNFSQCEPPDLTAMPESGMGVFLIHAFVDEVNYRGGSPNVLSLTKYTAQEGAEVQETTR